MKRIFKWLIGLFLVAVALVVIAVIVLALSYNSILRAVIERQIRAQTGMEVEIGSMKIALISPTVEIQNVKIHNSRNFGGTPFLDIPEIHVEYDRAAALRRHEIHIKLLRFNLGELDIVKNQAGQTNIFLPGVKLSAQKSGGGNSLADFKKQSGYDFTGIDMLNVSIGKVKYIDLNNQQNNREQTIGIDNCVIPNVKSLTDLEGLGLLVALRSGDFFGPMVGQTGILRMFGGGVVF